MFKFIFVCIASILLLTGCSSKEQNIQNNSSAQKTSATQNEIIKNNDSLKNSTNDTNTVNKESSESSSKKTPTEKELATFSTKILVKESGRQHNLHLTCDTLNGTRIEPGETFSFCNTVGKATKEKGYEEADVYDSEGNETKETLLRGDGTTWYIKDYENGNLKTETYYDADGKTPVKIIENDQLKMLKLKSKTENGATVINQYNFDENGVCTSSTLANSLHKQISGPSLNRNTIAFLKQLTPENVLKVLTSYEAIAGESLIDAISDEWGLNDEQFNDDMKVKDLIPTLVAERAKQLGFEPDENGQYNLDELFEADIQQSKESG